MQKRALIIHDTRGLGVAAAAETKTQLEAEGIQVDTDASFLETGLPANFFSKKIGDIQVSTYDEIYVLNIALDRKDPEQAIHKLRELDAKLRDEGKSLKYIDTHPCPESVRESIRSSTFMAFRGRSLNAALDPVHSERMLIGAISDRDCDPELLENLTDQRERTALGLDIAARGDFGSLIPILQNVPLEEIPNTMRDFLLDLWGDDELDESVNQKIAHFSEEVNIVKSKGGNTFIGLRNLIIKYFSEDFVARAVKELQNENYDWFLRLSEREPDFYSYINWSMEMGNVSVVPIPDPRTSWTFKILDKVVQKHGTQFGMSILRESADDRGVEEPADIITIIKNWRFPDQVRIVELFEREIGVDWKQKLDIQELRGREGNVTLRFVSGALTNEKVTMIQDILSDFQTEKNRDEMSIPERTVQGVLQDHLDGDLLANARGRKDNQTLRLDQNDEKSVEAFAELFGVLAGSEISEHWRESLSLAMKLYADILKKAQYGIAKLSKEYLGEEHKEQIRDLSGQLVKSAIKVIRGLIEKIKSQKEEEEFDINEIYEELLKINKDTEITACLTRSLPRHEVSAIDINTIKAVKILHFSGSELRQNPEITDQILRIIKVQFPVGDDQKFEDTVMKSSENEVIVSVSNGQVLAFYVVSKSKGTYHPDWFMANPEAPIKGLGEATLMYEFKRSDSDDRIYGAEVEPRVKSSDICIEKLGFAAYGDTTGDPDFKKRYWRISRDKMTDLLKGKNLSRQDCEEIITKMQESDFRDELKLDEEMFVVKLKMPEDNSYALDLMSERSGEYLISRYLTDPNDQNIRYCLFEKI